MGQIEDLPPPVEGKPFTADVAFLGYGDGSPPGRAALPAAMRAGSPPSSRRRETCYTAA